MNSEGKSTERSGGIIERRKQERYIMSVDTFAFLRPPVNKIGQLIDISLSGLAFSYFSSNGASLESNGLDILAYKEICLENVPYITVNDFIIPNEQPFSQVTMRRRCVKFDNLNPENQIQIQKLINQYGQLPAVLEN